MVAFSDWWQSLINRAEPEPRRLASTSTQRISQPSRLAGASVTNKTFRTGTEANYAPAAKNIYATPTRAPAAPRAISQRLPKNPTAVGMRQLQERSTTTSGLKQRQDVDAWWERENSGMPGLEQEAERQRKLEDLAAKGVRNRQLGRTPEQQRALERLQELDAKTRQRVDNEFALKDRDKRLGLVREMTSEDYAKLSPRQQAAVQFNTGLVAAGRADQESGTTDASREYLAGFGITPKDDTELTSFLRLDQLIGQSILDKLEDVTTRQQSADSARWARGDASAAPEATRFNAARNASDQAAEALGQLLSTTGNRRFGETAPRAGFGTALRDEVVKQAYSYMIDSRYTYTPQQIASSLRDLNQQAGTDVSTDELWEYLRANVDAVGFHEAGNNTATLPHPTELPNGEPLTPLDVAEIRRRYGI